MAKFCIHCGKKLEEGEVCSCQMQQATTQNNIGSDMLEAFKGMFVKPVDTLKEYADGKFFTLALILTGILAFITALFTCALVKNYYDSTVSAFGALGTYGLSSYYAVQVPYLKVFFTSLVVSFIFVFVYTGLLFLVNSIMFKGDKDFKKVFSLYGVNTIITSVTLLISTCFMFIHMALGLVIFALGSLLNTLYMYKGLEFLGVKDSNRHAYIYLITTIFYALVLFIVMLILS